MFRGFVLCNLSINNQVNFMIVKCLFIFLVSCFSSLIVSKELNEMSSTKLVSVDFEVYGIVQGVFFRKYTQQQASKLGLKGWCMNTESGTVKGVLEGNIEKVNEMKIWLQKTGSPQSRIDRAVFNNEKDIKSLTFDSFKIKH